MKFLKIEDNKGFFSLDGKDWHSIDEINKKHLLKLMDICLDNEFEMDIFDENILRNQAHQIIYKNIYEKFNDLAQKKSRFKDESEALYKTAIEKYRK